MAQCKVQSVIEDAITSLTIADRQYHSELMIVCLNVHLIPVVEQFSYNLLTAVKAPLHINTKPKTVPKIKEKINMDGVYSYKS